MDIKQQFEPSDPHRAVFSSLKNLILKLYNLVIDLHDKHEKLEKKIDHRAEELTQNIQQLESEKQDLLKRIQELEERQDKNIQRLIDLDNYIDDKRRTVSAWVKVWKAFTSPSGIMITFGTGMITLITWLINHFHNIPTP